MPRKLHARGRWRGAIRAHLARRWACYLYFGAGMSWLADFTFAQRCILAAFMLAAEGGVHYFVVRPLRDAMAREYANGVRQGRIAMYGEVARHLVTHDPQALARLESSQREGAIGV